MSLNPVGGMLGGIRPSPSETLTRGVRQEHVNAPAAPPQRPEQTAASASARRSSAALPIEAPEGTDPELWAVLSADERAFFSKMGAMGPLTYGHILSNGGGSAAPVSRGGRIDVKV